MNHTLKRIILFTAGLGLGLTLLTGTASAAPKNGLPPQAQASKATPAAPEHSSKDQDCNGTHHSTTGNGANDDQYPHAYSETCDGTPSGNGAPSESDPSGRPCAGCVGNADDKNPPGQAPDAQHDGDSGYECDRKGDVDGGNNGIAFGNPAHTGCQDPEPLQPVEEGNPPVNNPNNLPTVVTKTPPACPAGHMKVDVNNDGVLDASDCVPVCGDGPMTVDINGDGKLNGADCALAGLPVATAVLGVSYERPAEVAPAAAVARPAEVLGASFERRGLAPAALARTGSTVELAGLLMSGLALIAFGTTLLAKQGRRSTG